MPGLLQGGVFLNYLFLLILLEGGQYHLQQNAQAYVSKKAMAYWKKISEHEHRIERLNRLCRMKKFTDNFLRSLLTIT